MDRQVLDAMRVLQSGSVGPEVLAEVRKLVSALKSRRILDGTATEEILALLEQWAAATDPALRLEALQWGATLCEGETRCRLLRGAGDTAVANYGDVDGAITLYEQALDADADLELMVDLGNLYDKRGAEGDAEQAAALYTALGEFLGDEDGLDFLATALDMLPGHGEALDALEELVPADKHAAELSGRWRAYLEVATDPDGIAKRTMYLASAHAAEGKLEQALEMIDPLVQAGNEQARQLRHELIVTSDASSPAQPSFAPGVLSAVGRATLAGVGAPDSAESPDGGQPERRADPTPTEVSAPLFEDGEATDGGFEDAATYVMDAAPAGQIAQQATSQPAPGPEPAMLVQTHTAEPEPIDAATSSSAPPGRKRRRGFGWGWILAGVAMIGLAVPGGLWVVDRLQPAAAPAVPAAAPVAAPVAPPAPVAVPAAAVAPQPEQPAVVDEAPDAGANPMAPEAEPEAESEAEPAAEPEPTKRTDILVHVAMEHSRLRGGKLAKEGVEKPLLAILGELEACYDEAISRRPKLRGRLVLQWNVRRNGAVSGLRKVRSSLQDARMHRCVQDAVKSVTFAKPRRKPAKVRVPIDFTQPR